MIDINAVAGFLDSLLGCEFHERRAGALAGVVLWPSDPAFGHLHIGENVLEELDTEVLKRGIEDRGISEKLRDGRSYLFRLDENGEPMFFPLVVGHSPRSRGYPRS